MRLSDLQWLPDFLSSWLTLDYLVQLGLWFEAQCASAGGVWIESPAACVF